MPTKFRPSLHDVHACEQVMLALNEVDPNIAQFWFEPIEEMLSQIELPDIPCDICKIPMPFYDYYLKQGMCDKCSSETEVGEFNVES
jgi:hypothetical protein